MSEYRRGVTWGGFLLVVGTITLLSIVPLPFPREDSMGFLLWYWLGWASLGAFAGMSMVVGVVTRDLRSLWHIAVATFTVLCLGLFLRDQRFFGNVSVNFLCSLAVPAALVKCCAVNRQFSPGVRTFSRPITGVTALAVIIRLAAPPHFFLPLLYYPEWSLAQSRTTIISVFLSAMIAAIFIGAAVVWLQRHRRDHPDEIPFLERTISLPAGNRIAAVAAFIGALVFLWYFVLGLCSMSGGLPYPFPGVHSPDQAAVVRSASDYLTAHGARRTDEEYANFHRQRNRHGAQLASFEYPLHFGRVMRIAIFPDRDADERVMISFACSGITARDMGKSSQFNERMRTDFRRQAYQSRRASSDQE